MLFRLSVEIYQENELTCNSSGNARPQLSQLEKPLWTELTDPDLKIGIGERELIYMLKKKRRRKSAGSVLFVEPPTNILAC